MDRAEAVAYRLKLYYIEHKTQLNDYQRAYRAKNKDMINAKRALYKEENKEKNAAYQRAYWAANRDKLKAKAKEKRIANKKYIEN
jgi:hypothetical protein